MRLTTNDIVTRKITYVLEHDEKTFEQLVAKYIKKELSTYEYYQAMCEVCDKMQEEAKKKRDFCFVRKRKL